MQRLQRYMHQGETILKAEHISPTLMTKGRVMVLSLGHSAPFEGSPEWAQLRRGAALELILSSLLAVAMYDSLLSRGRKISQHEALHFIRLSVMASNGDLKRSEIPATKLLASFIACANTNQLSVELRAKVKEVLIDYCGVVSRSTAPISTVLAL